MNEPVEPKRPNTNTSTLVLIVFGSVIVFILSFSTACAWVLLAKWMITAWTSRQVAIRRLAICASVLTVITIGLALAFAFATRQFQTRVPLDTSAVLTNSNLDTHGPPVHTSEHNAVTAS